MAKKMAKKITVKLNRKGDSMISESDKMIFWFLILILIALCITFMVAWTNSLKKLYLNENLQPAAYETRLVYSGQCFAYTDSEGRAYPGIIDATKFTQNRLNECLPLDAVSEHAISAKLEIPGAVPLIADSANWDKSNEKIVIDTYVVEVKNSGPALLTFYNKIGS